MPKKNPFIHCGGGEVCGGAWRRLNLQWTTSVKPRAIPVRPSAVVLPSSARVCAPSMCSVVQCRGSRLAARGSRASPARESECVVTLTLVQFVYLRLPSKNAVASISLLLDANPCSQPSARAQTALPSPCSVEPRGRQGSGRGLRHRRVFPGRWLVQSSPSMAPRPRLSAAGPRGRVTLRTSLTRSSLKPCVHSALGPGPRQGWAWAVVSVVSLGHPGRKTRL